MNPLAADLVACLREPAQEAPSFRSFLTSADFCDLDLSPVVAAIVDASEGRPVELDEGLAFRIFGCPTGDLPTQARRTVVVRAGGRGGKTSRLLAPKALHATLTVPLPTLAPGEHARSLLIAPDLSLARQALGYVKGYVEGSPRLASLVVSENADCITLRRPHDGHLVDVTVGAATRGGKAARGRSLVFVGLDEAAFFYADDGYTVTDKEIYRAAIQRVVPGGQVWIVSTPWLEGVGVMEERLAEDLGRHEKSLVAVGGTRDLNPTWDPTGEIERDMRDDDPENAAREIDAQPLAAGTKFFFPPEVVRLALGGGRVEPLEPDGTRHAAGVDLAFRKNSSALAIARASVATGVRLAHVEEMKPERGKPLKPSEVCRAFGEVCQRYSAPTMVGDLHYADTAHEELAKLEGREVGYEEWTPTTETKAEAFTAFRRLMAEGRLELMKHPRLLSQIRATTSKVMEAGVVKIQLPKQGTSHGDVLMAVVLACVAANERCASGVGAPTGAAAGRWGAMSGRGFG